MAKRVVGAGRPYRPQSDLPAGRPRTRRTRSTSWTSASSTRPHVIARDDHPVEITVFEDRTFTFITKTPPASF